MNGNDPKYFACSVNSGVEKKLAKVKVNAKFD